MRTVPLHSARPLAHRIALPLRRPRPWLMSALALSGSLAAIAFAALLLLWPMLGKPYVYDEVSFAQMAEGIMNHGVPFANVGYMSNEDGAIDVQSQYGLWHPPLYLYLLGLTFKLFGDTETTARLFGVACMVLTALFTTLTIRESLRDHPNRDGFAVLGALLYVFNPLTLQSALVLDIDGTVLTALVMALAWLYLKLGQRGYAGLLLVAVVFALALSAKMTTPFFLLPAIIVYRTLQGRLHQGIADALVIGGLGGVLFLTGWWLVCWMTGMPFEFPFKVFRYEIGGAAGRGVTSLTSWDALSAAAQPSLRWIGPFLPLVLLFATLTRLADHLRFSASAAAGWLGNVRRRIRGGTAAKPGTRPSRMPANGVTGGQGIDLLLVLAWLAFILYMLKIAADFPKYSIAAVPPMAASAALIGARFLRRPRWFELALHPIVMAALVAYFFFEVGEQYIDAGGYAFLAPMLIVPAAIAFPALLAGVIAGQRVAPQLVLLPVLASLAWALPVIYQQSLSEYSTDYYYNSGGALEIAATAAEVLGPDELYLASKDVAYYLPNKNYVDQDSLWSLLNIYHQTFDGTWFGTPIRVIIIFGRDPFARQQFYSAFDGMFEVRQVIGDYALLTRIPGPG